jgi:uncharacterized protein with PQ loop repeat
MIKCIKIIMKNKKIKRGMLSSLVLVVAIVEPLTTVPQIYQIWSSRSASGVSRLTWSGDVVAAAIWLIYGCTQKDKPLIMSSALWIIAEGLVVYGTVLY